MPKALSRKTATGIGVAAIFCWASVMGTCRLSSVAWGVFLGPALVYTVAAVMLWIVRTPHDLRHFPKKYLLVGGVLMAYTEIVLSIALGLASDSVQTVQVSIVNYLWPTFTVLVGIFASKSKPRWLIVPGTLLATGGVFFALGGDAGLDVDRWIANVSSNPLPYVMALTVAIAWAFYSVYSPRFSEGHDGVTPFFTLIALWLWALFFANGAPMPETLPGVDGALAVLAAAAALASGYACWNIGILKGNLKVMATASYLAPLLSSLASSIILSTALSVQFWVSAAAVTAGSLLSWLATR